MSIPIAAPEPLAQGTLRVTPLGGLGEVGRNMTTFEYGGKILIVDCGVLFPEEHQPGVDLILPDFEPIKHRLDDIVGVVLTHGHEDHIGAVPYLLRLKQDIPLIGSGLTLALVEAKLKELLGDRVGEVKVSARLTDSPSCLALSDYEMAPHLARLLREAGQDMPESKPTLEINPRHALVKRVEAEADEDKARDLATLLLEQAEISAGAQLPDPAAFVQRMNRVLLG